MDACCSVGAQQMTATSVLVLDKQTVASVFRPELCVRTMPEHRLNIGCT